MLSSSAPNVHRYPELVTKADVEHMVNNIDQFIDTLYMTRGSLTEKIEACFTARQRPIIEETLASLVRSDWDPVLVKNKTLEFKAILQRLPILTLRIAVDLPLQVITQVAEWFWGHYHYQVILDLVIEPELIGGLVIHQGGSYKDYSLKKSLQEMCDRRELTISHLFSEI